MDKGQDDVASMQSYRFTFIIVRMICFMSVGICHEFSFAYLFFLPDTDVIMTLLHHFVIASFAPFSAEYKCLAQH